MDLTLDWLQSSVSTITSFEAIGPGTDEIYDVGFPAKSDINIVNYRVQLWEVPQGGGEYGFYTNVTSSSGPPRTFTVSSCSATEVAILVPGAPPGIITYVWSTEGHRGASCTSNGNSLTIHAYGSSGEGTPLLPGAAVQVMAGPGDVMTIDDQVFCVVKRDGQVSYTASMADTTDGCQFAEARIEDGEGEYVHRTFEDVLVAWDKTKAWYEQPSPSSSVTFSPDC